MRNPLCSPRPPFEVVRRNRTTVMKSLLVAKEGSFLIGLCAEGNTGRLYFLMCHNPSEVALCKGAGVQCAPKVWQSPRCGALMQQNRENCEIHEARKAHFSQICAQALHSGQAIVGTHFNPEAQLLEPQTHVQTCLQLALETSKNSG